ncbi:MAG: hypothetical protein R3C03_05945 [Pirellulaceae bacterium]
MQPLLKGIVDYAGLFPPAQLDMQTATQNFAQYRASDDDWILGRFVVPLARLSEFESAATAIAGQEVWPLSVLVSGPTGNGETFHEALKQITEFNSRQNIFLIDSVETKLDDVNATQNVANSELPTSIRFFWEVANVPNIQESVKVIAAFRGNHAAKIRTGSVNADQIPSAKIVAEFIFACVQNGTPFKATAGLHHPLRGDYRLTYEEDSKCGTMFGFLNVFVAALCAHNHRLQVEQIADILQSNEPQKFVVSADETGWGEWTVDTSTVAKLRDSFCISFGSCSFREPVDEFNELQFSGIA